MPIKKWLFQYIALWPAAFTILAAVQYLKGRSIDYAISFGLLWASISILVFALTRVYYYRKRIYCKVCNDLPVDKLD